MGKVQEKHIDVSHLEIGNEIRCPGFGASVAAHTLKIVPIRGEGRTPLRTSPFRVPGASLRCGPDGAGPSPPFALLALSWEASLGATSAFPSAMARQDAAPPRKAPARIPPAGGAGVRLLHLSCFIHKTVQMANATFRFARFSAPHTICPHPASHRGGRSFSLTFSNEFPPMVKPSERQGCMREQIR